MTPPAPTPATWLVRLQAACATQGLRAVAQQLGLSATTLSMVNRGVYMAATDRVAARVAALLPEQQDEAWLAALRQLRDAQGGAQAADRVGVSEATVSQVLSGNYKAATTRVERRVRGELLGATCDCPVMGEVSTRVCQDVQERQPPIANPQHAQAWFACRGRGPFTRAGVCPHFNGAGRTAAAQPAPATPAQEPQP